MNKTEINAKLQYLFEGLPLSKEQKQIFSKIVTAIIENAIENNNSNIATINDFGLVKQANSIELLEESDDISSVISTINQLISNLKDAGIIKN